MCGDLDDDLQLDEEIYSRFLVIAGHRGAKPGEGKMRDLAQLGANDKPGPYMEGLFTDLLREMIDDNSSMPEGKRADSIANQAIVLARLAGFLVGQFSAETDLYRCAIEAFSDGYAEPSRLIKNIQNQHHHHHDHQHG